MNLFSVISYHTSKLIFKHVLFCQSIIGRKRSHHKFHRDWCKAGICFFYVYLILGLSWTSNELLDLYLTHRKQVLVISSTCPNICYLQVTCIVRLLATYKYLLITLIYFQVFKNYLIDNIIWEKVMKVCFIYSTW